VKLLQIFYYSEMQATTLEYNTNVTLTYSSIVAFCIITIKDVIVRISNSHCVWVIIIIIIMIREVVDFLVIILDIYLLSLVIIDA